VKANVKGELVVDSVKEGEKIADLLIAFIN